MSDEQDKAADSAIQMGLDDLSQIFAPSWARQTPDEVAQKAARFARDDDDRGDFRRGGDRRPPRRDSDRRPPRRDDDRRPPRRDDDRRPPRRDDDRRPPRRDDDRRPPRRDDDRRPPRRDDDRRFAPPPPPLDIDVRFMPATKALAAIIRRIQATHRAYPIRDIVKLFQNDDSSMAVRIEARKDGAGPQQIFQCRACGMPALTEAEVADHLLKKHLSDAFDVEEVEGEAPKGNFPCVARCGLTGELLGPPNHHSYAHRVQEMLTDRFPGMSEEEYRRHIEMVRDPEVVEQWREQCKHRRVYRRKPEPSAMEKAEAQPPAEEWKSEEAPAEAAPAEEPKPAAPALERHEAELVFRREIMPGLIGAASHVICPATSLKDLPDRRLAGELNARFADETDPGRRHRMQPATDGATPQSRLQRNGSLFAAIHAAFHHRGLYFFRTGDERGQEFVMASQPVPFDLTHATPELREIAQYVADHPSCPPKFLVDALNPENDEEKTKRLISQIKWLVEKGYLVEFFNGFLSPPAPHPIFKPNPPKPKKAAAQPAAAEPQAEVAAASAKPAAPEVAAASAKPAAPEVAAAVEPQTEVAAAAAEPAAPEVAAAVEPQAEVAAAPAEPAAPEVAAAAEPQAEVAAAPVAEEQKETENA